MILNALDEILFWDDIALLKTFITDINKKYYPHNPIRYHEEKTAFLKTHIPTKDVFTSKLTNYMNTGTATWIVGRNNAIDDIDFDSLVQ